MEKAVGLDLEHHAPPGRSIDPSGTRDVTPMVVARRRRSEHSKRVKAVFALDVGSGCIQSAPIQGLLEGQLIPTAERRVCSIIRTDVITVSPAQSTVARVKLVLHLGRRSDPYVGGQDRVQRAPQLLNGPSLRYSNSDRLTSRMHAGISTSRPCRRDPVADEALERLFQYALYGPLIGLALPSAELGPVIVQYELHSAFGHCWKATRPGGCVKQACSRV